MFELPELPYAYDALEPFISKQIQELHHDRHHKAYTDNLNKALSKYSEWESKSIEEIIKGHAKAPEDVRTALRNHGGGFYNHSLFWKMMSPKKEQRPEGSLMDAINAQFGSYDSFVSSFSDAAGKLFGSGWEWLVFDDGKLALVGTANQDSPLTQGKVPLLGLDVWEHAYYPQYYNKRPDYISAWWHVVNWEDVQERFDEARK